MAESDFEKVKKIVRSVLIPCQRGCTLREFLRSYKELNGVNLPCGKLGFSSELHLLQNMPDAVIIQHRGGDVVLSAVADKSTQHIQNMVSRQKAPKKKTPLLAAPVFSRRYSIPPRFSQKSVAPAPRPSSNSQIAKKVAPIGLQKKISKLVERFPSGLSLSQFLASFERVNGEPLKFRSIGFFTLEECLETVPNISMKTVNNEIFVNSKVSENSHGTQYTASTNRVSANVTYSQVAQSNVQETSTVKSSTLQGNSSYSPSPVVQSNFQKSRIESSAKFKTNQEQPEPPHHEVDTGLKWKSISFTPNDAEASGGRETASRSVSRMNSQEFEEPEDIPPFVIRNLHKLADMYPDGIKATEFPSIYENVINTEFDLHSLGYNDLSVFIDAVPHIFKRVEILGTKKNWLIVPASKKICEVPNKKALLHDTIISNIRTLLEASPEGISIDDFLHVYSINCLEPLCIGEFGFTSLESFLMNNGNQVPLMIASSDYGKRVHLVQAPELRSPEPRLKLNSEFLSDVVLPGTDIFCVKLPSDLNLSEYFLVHVSSVENPSTFYIQLKRYDDERERQNDRIEKFYKSSASDLYTMKTNHVKVNTVCIALWPHDKLWYRVIITSILSLEEVQVFYFDYGTKDIIPVTMLRYMKKEFSILPAQALLSNLACLKPADNSDHWSPEACNKMLSICANIDLMAQIYCISDDGVLSLVLCDTNGDKEVFINDVLLDEKLAELVPEPGTQEQHLEVADSVPESLTWVNPVAADFQTLSLNNSPFIPPPAPPIPAPLPHTSPIPAPIPAPSLYLTSVSTPFPSTASFSNEAASTSPTDSDVFDDDDDMFEKFCEEALSVMKRYVKRVRTPDAYIFHVICVEGELFVSCGDISAMIWDKKDVDYLMQRLQNRQYHVPSLKILEYKGNEDMFYQIERFFVKGFLKINEDESQILVCPLSNIIEILNLLGQPSADLRRQIQNEIENFNPSDPTWMELSQGQIPDKEEVVISTDDDKLNRLCLYDLIAMKESIRLRAERVQNNIARGGSGMEEIMRMEQLLTRVVHRINQIKEVCQEFNR